MDGLKVYLKFKRYIKYKIKYNHMLIFKRKLKKYP